MQRTIALEYNSQRENLEIPEYGRHIQKLVNYATTIDDKAKRQEAAASIVHMMLQMNPQNKNVEEYIERLWKHIFRISDYKLDIEAPEGIDTSKPNTDSTLESLAYPQKEYNHRHYGHSVQVLIEKAITMEDPEKKEEFTRIIAAYMKLAYRTWNREHYVNDEIIKTDISVLSEGKLQLGEEYTINNLQNNKGRNSKGRHSRSNSRHSGGRRQRNKR